MSRIVIAVTEGLVASQNRAYSVPSSTGMKVLELITQEIKKGPVHRVFLVGRERQRQMRKSEPQLYRAKLSQQLNAQSVTAQVVDFARTGNILISFWKFAHSGTIESPLRFSHPCLRIMIEVEVISSYSMFLYAWIALRSAGYTHVTRINPRKKFC